MTVEDVYEKFNDRFPAKVDVDRVQSQSKAFNDLLGGGIPKGMVVAIWAEEKVGKTHVALEICKAFCDSQYHSVYLDTESSLKRDLVKGIGLEDYFEENKFLVHKDIHHSGQLEELLIGDPEDPKDEGFVQQEETGAIVIDSLASVSSASLFERSVADASVGDKSNEDTKLLNKVQSMASEHDTTLILIQQARANIDMNPYTGGRDVKMAGGHGLKHWIDVLIHLQRRAVTAGEDGIDYANVRFLTEKNKTAKDERSRMIPIRYGYGFDPVLLVIDQLEENEDQLDWYEQAGPYYKLWLDDEKYQEQGKEKFEQNVVQERLHDIVEKLSNENL